MNRLFSMNPYHPPTAPGPAQSPPSSFAQILAIAGASLQISPLLGFAWIAVSMKKAFNALGSSGADVNALAAHIGEVVVATLISFFGSLIGLGIFFIALMKFRYRAPWCFTFLLISGCLYLLAFPIGTVAGILLIIYARRHKNEFQYPESLNSPTPLL